MEKVKTAIIGCGAISDIYMKNLTSRFSIIDLKACCDRDEERVHSAAEKYGLKIMTMEEILEDASIEMVVNLTNPMAHYSVIRECLLAGKHVYTEKVLAVELEQAEELVQIANEKGLYLGAAPDTFLGGAIQTARQAVEAGLIGEVTSFCAFTARDYKILAEIFPYVAQTGGGIGFDMGAYYVTALLSILGPAKRVTGMVHQDSQREAVHFMPHNADFDQTYHITAETMLMGVVELESKVMGTLHLNSDCIYPEQPYLVICGTEGIISMADPNNFGGAVYLRAKGADVPVELPCTFGYNTNSRGIGAAEMAWSIRRGRKNRANKEMAYHVLEVLHGIVISDKTGKTYELKSRFEKMPPLPRGYLDETYNDSDPEAALT